MYYSRQNDLHDVHILFCAHSIVTDYPYILKTEQQERRQLNMTERQIHTFLLAAEVGSIARTAELLYISQPAVSKHLSQLEDELNIKLFERSRTGLSITPGGQLLYDFFQKYNTNLAQALEEARTANRKEINLLRVGSREGWNIASFFQRTVEVFHERYPEISISLNVLREDKLIDLVLNSKLDFIITTKQYLKQRRDLSCHELCTLTCGLLYSANHILASKHDLSVQDFKNDTFWVISENSQENHMISIVKDRCKSMGFAPQIAIAPSVASAYSMIQSNRGVILVPEWSMARFNPLFRFLPIDVKTNVVSCWINDDQNMLKLELHNELINSIISDKYTP